MHAVAMLRLLQEPGAVLSGAHTPLTNICSRAVTAHAAATATMSGYTVDKLRLSTNTHVRLFLV